MCQYINWCQSNIRRTQWVISAFLGKDNNTIMWQGKILLQRYMYFKSVKSFSVHINVVDVMDKVKTSLLCKIYPSLKYNFTIRLIIFCISNIHRNLKTNQWTQKDLFFVFYIPSHCWQQTINILKCIKVKNLYSSVALTLRLDLKFKYFELKLLVIVFVGTGWADYLKKMQKDLVLQKKRQKLFLIGNYITDFQPTLKDHLLTSSNLTVDLNETS